MISVYNLDDTAAQYRRREAPGPDMGFLTNFSEHKRSQYEQALERSGQIGGIADKAYSRGGWLLEGRSAFYLQRGQSPQRFWDAFYAIRAERKAERAERKAERAERIRELLRMRRVKCARLKLLTCPTQGGELYWRIELAVARLALLTKA